MENQLLPFIGTHRPVHHHFIRYIRVMRSRSLMWRNAVKRSGAAPRPKRSGSAAAKPGPGAVNAGDMIPRQRPARRGMRRLEHRGQNGDDHPQCDQGKRASLQTLELQL